MDIALAESKILLGVFTAGWIIVPKDVFFYADMFI